MEGDPGNRRTIKDTPRVEVERRVAEGRQAILDGKRKPVSPPDDPRWKLGTVAAEEVWVAAEAMPGYNERVAQARLIGPEGGAELTPQGEIMSPVGAGSAASPTWERYSGVVPDLEDSLGQAWEDHDAGRGVELPNPPSSE